VPRPPSYITYTTKEFIVSFLPEKMEFGTSRSNPRTSSSMADELITFVLLTPLSSICNGFFIVLEKY
uniref:Uncharacterized protein n=1 Tax=Oryza brachyantha TaxID=4533 RepID=J3LBN4_ORYBR